jgi:hypothetical protein
MLRATNLSLGLLLLLAPACGEKGDESATDNASTGGTTVDPPATDPGTTAGETAEPGTTAEQVTTSTSPMTETGDPMTSSTTTVDPATSTTSDTSGLPGCDAYCKSITDNCTGEHSQYGAPEFCQGSCAAFPLGEASDMSGNTLGCRTYHAGAAAMDPAVHCGHAGPGGGSACGENCEGFCSIAQTACPEVWADAGACMAACANFDPAEPYDATDVKGNSLACRLYHATAAAVDPVTHCAHIKGDSMPCM